MLKSRCFRDIFLSDYIFYLHFLVAIVISWIDNRYSGQARLIMVIMWGRLSHAHNQLEDIGNSTIAVSGFGTHQKATLAYNMLMSTSVRIIILRYMQFRFRNVFMPVSDLMKYFSIDLTVTSLGIFLTREFALVIDRPILEIELFEIDILICHWDNLKKNIPRNYLHGHWSLRHESEETC